MAKCLQDRCGLVGLVDSAWLSTATSQPTDVLGATSPEIPKFCQKSRKEINEKMDDIGYGLNYKRKSFLKLMEMVETGDVSEIVIAHKDRLVRFGFEWFEKFCYEC